MFTIYIQQIITMVRFEGGVGRKGLTPGGRQAVGAAVVKGEAAPPGCIIA